MELTTTQSSYIAALRSSSYGYLLSSSGAAMERVDLSQTPPILGSSAQVDNMARAPSSRLRVPGSGLKVSGWDFALESGSDAWMKLRSFFFASSYRFIACIASCRAFDTQDIFLRSTSNYSQIYKYCEVSAAASCHGQARAILLLKLWRGDEAGGVDQ